MVRGPMMAEVTPGLLDDVAAALQCLADDLLRLAA
jgi:hypothetical protein